MKKKIYGILILIIIIGIGYSSIWLKSYNQARRYYVQAMENYNNGHLSIALKGDVIKNPESSGYTYIGGFQQALEIFESDYAFPKPSISEKSKVMVYRIISEMDLNTGQSIFKANFGKDNRFLPEILIRIGDIHLSNNDEKKAKEAYQMVIDAFERYREAYDIATKKLEDLNE